MAVADHDPALEAPSGRTTLGSEDWVAAGLSLLAESGVDGVQITLLARRLAVTRGSFYWHFENRQALLDALLGEWRRRNTGVMLDALTGAETLEDGILALFAVWVDHSRFDPLLDKAVRDWGRRSDAVRRVVAEEDADRVRAIATLFRAHGYAETEAFIRARVLYLTQVGFYALQIEEPMAERVSYLSAYFAAFTGREIDPTAARRFAAILMEAKA